MYQKLTAHRGQHSRKRGRNYSSAEYFWVLVWEQKQALYQSMPRRTVLLAFVEPSSCHGSYGRLLVSSWDVVQIWLLQIQGGYHGGYSLDPPSFPLFHLYSEYFSVRSRRGGT